MMVPDYAIIAEIILYSEGFEEAKVRELEFIPALDVYIYIARAGDVSQVPCAFATVRDRVSSSDYLPYCTRRLHIVQLPTT